MKKHQGIFDDVKFVEEYTFLKEGLDKSPEDVEGERYRSIVKAELEKLFDPTGVPGRKTSPPVYPGQPVREPVLDLVRVPVMYNPPEDKNSDFKNEQPSVPNDYSLRRYVVLSNSVDEYGNPLPYVDKEEARARNVKKPKPDPLAPVNIGCDCLLSGSGQVMYVPEPKDIQSRMLVMSNWRINPRVKPR